MKTSEAISKINKGEAVDQDVLSDIRETRVSFREALLLAEHGFVIPQENVHYDDADIAYDADFDEVEWEEKRTSLHDMLSSKGITTPANDKMKITIELSVEDEAIKDWLTDNADSLKEVVNKLVVDLYHTEKLLKAE